MNNEATTKTAEKVFSALSDCINESVFGEKAATFRNACAFNAGFEAGINIGLDADPMNLPKAEDEEVQRPVSAALADYDIDIGDTDNEVLNGIISRADDVGPGIQTAV